MANKRITDLIASGTLTGDELHVLDFNPAQFITAKSSPESQQHQCSISNML